MAIGEEEPSSAISSSPKMEYTSPFFLGPQDRPGDFITPVRLTGDNYDDWSSSVRLALRARRKFVFINGTITEPTPPWTEEDWLTIHSMLVSWILNTISLEVKTTLSKFDDAKLLWDDLKERFSIVDGPKIHQVKSDIAHCEQSKTQTVAIYYGKLKVLWDELNNYEPLIACCGKCTCKINSLHEQRRESERLHQFLMGLSADFYGQIRSQLLSQTPLPTLNRVFQQISQEERVRGIMQNKNKDDHSEILGFAVHGGRPKPDHKIDKTNLLCTHCKSRGHELSSCFEIIGYPEWWGPRPRISHATAKKPARETGSNFSPLQLEMRPDYCGSTGNQGNQSLLRHPSGPPRQMGRPNGSTRAHVVSAAGDSGFDMLATGSTSANSLPMEPMYGPLPGFSHDQWQSLFAAFGSSSSPSCRMTGPSLEESDWAG